MNGGRYIGVMSGTSLDGIDVVLAAIDQQTVIQHGRYSHPLPAELKQQILLICQGQHTTLSALGQLDARLGVLFAEAIQGLLQAYAISAEAISAIGCHGQTVWHEPIGDIPFTLQLGDNNRIAALTGITTVGDFRRRDMALGGQGAPLVPAFHHALLSHPGERRIVLNIGGIANISLLFPNQAVGGFDTGPGNILMDIWIGQQKGEPFDRDAKWALSGHPDAVLLQQMLADPYFQLLAPKSSGREYFNTAWLAKQLAAFSFLPPQDIQATLAELTAVTIADQVLAVGGCQRLLVCGGGARNPLLMSRLSTLLPDVQIALTEQYGVSGDNMEALAFAWLAARTMAGLPGNLPSVTGAAIESVLGAIYPATGTTHSSR